MKNREVYVLKEAVADLEEGHFFYDSLISDLEALRFFAGIQGIKFWQRNYYEQLFVMKTN